MGIKTVGYEIVEKSLAYYDVYLFCAVRDKTVFSAMGELFAFMAIIGLMELIGLMVKS